MGDNIQPDSSKAARKGNNVIKFGKARKSLARAAKDKKSAENRARFGVKKTEKERKAMMTKKLQDKLDAHKLDAPSDDT